MGARARRAFTLVEVIVAMVILGLVASAVAFSLGGRPARPERDQWTAALDSARREAARTGRPVVLSPGGSDGRSVTALPDGRVIGLDVDSSDGPSESGR